jgi:hypothetical protein
MTVLDNPVTIRDSKLAREIMESVRDTESQFLFNHSSRVYLVGALVGEHRGLKFYPELPACSADAWSCS